MRYFHLVRDDLRLPATLVARLDVEAVHPRLLATGRDSRSSMHRGYRRRTDFADPMSYAGIVHCRATRRHDRIAQPVQNASCDLRIEEDGMAGYVTRTLPKPERMTAWPRDSDQLHLCGIGLIHGYRTADTGNADSNRAHSPERRYQQHSEPRCRADLRVITARVRKQSIC